MIARYSFSASGVHGRRLIGRIFTVLFLLSNITFGFCADDAMRQHTCRITGYGKIFYSPDRFDLSFAVVTENVDPSRCKEQHLAALTKLKAFLDEQGKALVSLRQDATTLNRPLLSHNERPFVYTTSFSARLREASVLIPFQEGIVNAGVTDLQGLDFFSERQPELLDEARREAIKDAKRKAELAAKELGWKLSGANDIAFTEESWRSNPKASVYFGSRGSVAVPQKPSDISTYVDSGVTIQFQFQENRP